MTDLQSIQVRSAPLSLGQIVWHESGRGDALVFLHGVGSSAHSFKAQLEGLAARWRVVAWDMPGYGGSAHLPDTAPDVEAYADAAAQWLDALGVGQCHLVGHSLGSLIAARFAATRPERVRSLTLASCAIGHARLDAAERARLLTSRLDDVAALGPRGMAQKRGPRLLGPDAQPKTIQGVIDVMAQVDPQGYAQAARMLSGGDMLADLAQTPLTVPVQVVYGLEDVITPPPVNLRAAQARAAISVATIERAGHALYAEAPGAFNDIVETFAGAQR